MSGRYFYKGVDIKDLIETDGFSTDNINGFEGFPKPNTVLPYQSKINKPFEFMYKGTSDDISNSCNAYFVAFGPNTDEKNVTTSVNQSMNINKIQFKHISAYAWGGGGGGGGGGGAQTYWNKNGAAGQGGGNAGYAAVTNFKVNSSNLYIQYGGGGNYGSMGNTRGTQDNMGNDGGAGEAGGESFIKLNNENGTTIIQANGGNGGSGGNGGNEGSNGNKGDPGTTGNGLGIVNNSTTATNYTYNGQFTTTNPSTATVWPIRNTGNAGGGGNWASHDGPDASPGNAGNAGYVGVYFLYNPNI